MAKRVPVCLSNCVPFLESDLHFTKLHVLHISVSPTLFVNLHFSLYCKYLNILCTQITQLCVHFNSYIAFMCILIYFEDFQLIIYRLLCLCWYDTNLCFVHKIIYKQLLFKRQCFLNRQLHLFNLMFCFGLIVQSFFA